MSRPGGNLAPHTARPTLPCGCPVHIVEDEGHQSGCPDELLDTAPFALLDKIDLTEPETDDERAASLGYAAHLVRKYVAGDNPWFAEGVRADDELPEDDA